MRHDAYATAIAAYARDAATCAYDVYRERLTEPERSGATPDRVVPSGADAPAEPLRVALADLGSAAYAVAEMLPLAAILAGDRERLTEATAAAAAAASAAVVATRATGYEDACSLRIELAHRAAQSAHLAAGLISRDSSTHAIDAPNRARQRAPAFPASRRRLLRALTVHIEAARSRAPASSDPLSWRIVDAAGAARDAAARVVAEYDSWDASRLGLRFARIAMRASCHAGFAVLQLLPRRNAPA